MSPTNSENESTARGADAVRVARRTLLLGAGAAATFGVAERAYAEDRGLAYTDDRGPAYAGDREIAQIERRYERRIGLYAKNLRTGRTLCHRQDERFAMCSTFKTLAVGAVLAGRLITPDRSVLARRVHYPPSLVAGAGYAPRMADWQQAGYAPRVAEICAATLEDSDNAAANWLLQLIGGPTAVTALARQLGDPATQLTRWEPDLNDWAPGQIADTTTARAIGETYRNLLLDDLLPRAERRRLIGWMSDSRTGGETLRKGLPSSWQLAAKTGSGAYATRNDVGIAWTAGGVPIVISCLTRAEQPTAETVNEPLAEVARWCAQRLG